ELARAVERGRRSGVGTWTFAHGGFVLEGGRRDLAEHVAPLLARLPIPASWRCVLAVPKGSPGLAGDEEAAALGRRPSPNAGGGGGGRQVWAKAPGDPPRTAAWGMRAPRGPWRSACVGPCGRAARSMKAVSAPRERGSGTRRNAPCHARERGPPGRIDSQGYR